jgi:hypothetical protein
MGQLGVHVSQEVYARGSGTVKVQVAWSDACSLSLSLCMCLDKANICCIATLVVIIVLLAVFLIL